MFHNGCDRCKDDLILYQSKNKNVKEKRLMAEILSLTLAAVDCVNNCKEDLYMYYFVRVFCS